MKNKNLLNRLWTDSHEKQSPQRFARYAAILIMLLTLGVGQMWAGWRVYYGDETNQVYIHLWNAGSDNTSWDNKAAMTLVPGTSNVWYYEVSQSSEFNCIFCKAKKGGDKFNLDDITVSSNNLKFGKDGKTGTSYTPPCVVTYDGNGSTSGSTSPDVVEYNTSVTLRACGATKSGYHFTGWNTAANGSGTPYAAGASYTVTTNVTLYAQWLKTIYVLDDASFCTVNLYTWGDKSIGDWPGQGTSTSYVNSLGSNWYEVNIPDGVNNFLLNNNNKGKQTHDLSPGSYEDGISYHFTGPTDNKYNLVSKTLTVTVNMHGHDESYSSYAGSYYYNALITEEDEPSASGYTFDGWYTEAGYENEWNFATDHVTSNVDLHAKWTADAPTEYTLTYGVANSPYNNGSLSEVTVGGVDASSGESYTSGSEVSLTANPNPHYHVKGWYSDNSCSSAIAGAGTDNPYVFDLDDNTTVYVGFEINKTTITLDANGGAADREVVATYGSSFPSFSAITRTGYTLNGYFTASSGGTKIINADGTLVASTSYSDASSNWNSDATTLTLHAQWTAKTYTVNFDQQSGTGGSTSVTATFGSAMPDATMPTRSGFDFGGYFTLTGGKGAKYYNANGTSAGSWDIDTNPTTLYAYWVPEATWYLMGDDFEGWGRSTSYPFNHNYRGIARVYYREVAGPSNNCFKIHDGTVEYGYPGGADQIVTINGDAYTYTYTGRYYSFRRTIPEGTTAWFVINTSTSKIWIMSPLSFYSVSVTNDDDQGSVTMSATDDYTDQSITGTQFASGETVTIVVTPESGYQISSVTFDDSPIVAVSEDGYAKTYSVTMPSSDAELEVVYEEIPPEWKMYNGATLLGTFTGSGPYTAIINHTAGNSSNQYFELNGTAYQLAADCQLTSEQTLSTGSTQHAWTTDDYGYYRVSISTPDEGSTWKVQATRVYAVTYDGNGNTSGTAPATQYYAVGETIITATKGDLVYTGLHFYGWNTAADGSGNHYAESASAGTMTSAGLNLYAEWEDLSSSWVLKGGTNVTGDDWSTKHMLLKKPGHTDEDVVYYTASISSTNAGDNESNAYSFKIVKQGDPDTWYGLGSGDGEWWYYRSSGEQTMGTSNKNIQIIADYAGDYEIKVDYTDPSSNPKVTVTFPIDGNYNVTLSAGSHGSVANEGTLTIHEFPKVAISATPEPGYRFTGWTVDSDHSSYISFDNSSNASTNVWATDAAAAGATITANFDNSEIIYFDASNIVNEWGDKVYVTFFKYNFHWNDGDGKDGALIVENWVDNALRCVEMTRIPDSRIYYLDYSNLSGHNDVTQYVLFTSKWFNNPAPDFYRLNEMAAVTRGDYDKTTNNICVPETWREKDKNKVGYYCAYWMNYQDDEAGIKLKVYSGGGDEIEIEGQDEFELEIPGTKQFTASVNLSANTTYSISLQGDNGTWYNNDNSGTMTSTSCKAWPFVDRQKTPGHITTTADGTYRFTLNCADKLYLTADYPLAVGDYQVVFNGKVAVGGTTEKYSSSVIRHIGDAGTKKDTLSFFVVNGDSWTMQLQRCTALSPTITWANVGDELDTEHFGSPATGIYNFVVEQDSTAGTPVTPAFATMTPELYTGEYYIRSDAADGGWEAYKRAIDNKMIYSSFSQQHSGFDYYHCKYKGTGTNVKFCIANDYSARLSDTLYTDTHASTGEGVLPYQANIRFMWNSETNVCSRAYLNGSSDGTAEYLKIASDPSKTVCNSGTKANNAGIIDKNGAIMLNNATTFEDLGNWVYQIDLKALEGGRVKLTSDYRYGGVSHNQWFKGKDGDWSDANTEQIMGGEANEYHLLRVIYDFKTNHMLSAWLVDQDANITGNRSVNADVLILRTGHEDAKQITFSGSGVKLDDVDTIYSAIELRKSHILGSGSQASKEFYWVSFPYDVKISDIFGSVGNFNIDWAIQYYNGKKRAQNGFWSDSEPNWEFFKSNTETLKANEGYVLTLALRKFLKTGTGSKWDNGVDSLYLYFPSANKIGTILKKDTILKIDTVGYQCTIDRRTDKETPNIDKDRRVADSHWHCIGIPSFANSTRSTGSSWTTSEGESSSITDEDDIPNIVQWTSPSLLFLYSWNMTTNKLTPVATSTYTFKAMHAYLVQYANDTIHWKAVSRPSKIVARQRTAVQSQEFRLEVRKNNVVEDQTFIHFSDEEGVTAGFEFGRDLSKEFNNNSANIYTFADYVPVAGNSMPLETEQTTVVPMGVKVAANGEYTIAMPEGTNGIGVVLVDNVAGTRTNLGLTDYTINLSAGQYNGRFVLEVSPIMHTPTGIEEVAGDGAQGIGARKVLIDGVMYIVRDGKIFDARGNRVE